MTQGFITQTPIIPSQHGRALRSYLPLFYQESDLIQQYAQIEGVEYDKIFQLLGELLSQSFVKNAIWTLSYWENLFSIPVNVSDSLILRRARVLSFLYAHSRIRRIDIESILREFLTGPKAHVVQGYDQEVTEIDLDNIDGFQVGDNVFVAGIPLTISGININRQNTITLSGPVQPFPNAVVSKSYVLTIEEYSLYTFVINVVQSQIINQVALVDAIERAKPAHLGWVLQGISNVPFLFNDVNSLTNTASDLEGISVNVLYQNP